MMDSIATPADAATLRRAYGAFPSGVIAVCALVDGVPVGIAASSFTSVSMDPPLVSVCVQHSSNTWPLLRSRPRLGLSILAEHQTEACVSLASKSADRFAAVPWDVSETGAVFVRDAACWLECEPRTEIDAGDHVIALTEIRALSVNAGVAPLVFHSSQFRRLATG